MAATPTKTKTAKQTSVGETLKIILKDRLDDLTDKYLSLLSVVKTIHPSVAKLDEDSLRDITRKSFKEYLDAIIVGDSARYALKFKVISQTNNLSQDKLLSADVIRLEELRKRALRDLLPSLTTDVQHAIDVLGEIDEFHSNLIFKLLDAESAQTWNDERDLLIDQLRRSEELYKQAQAITHVGNWDWSIEANEVNWTDELYRIYGLEPQSQQINLESFLKMVHPDDVAAVVEQTRRTVEEKEAGNFYHRIVLPDGRERILHAKSEALIDSSGKVYKIIGTSQDVTVEKQLEKKIQDSQHFIEKIANATPCLIASYNIHSGKYVFVSAGITKILGYKPEQVLEQGVSFFMERLHPDDIPALMKKNGDALLRANDPSTLDDDIIVEFQYRLMHTNGEYRWLHTFGTIFDRNSKNEVEHVLNISLDITESVHASEKLRLKTLELEQSNANLEEFAFVVSHDLKEPLRKIITFSDRLFASEKSVLSADGKTLLEKITNSTIRMQQMINDLLSLSVISADKSFSHANLKRLLEEVLIMFEHKIEEKNARIEISDLPDVTVVPSQIRQLFQNLLSNAFKFAKQNVPLSIIIKHKILSPAEADGHGYSNHERLVEIKVEDNGIGFNDAYVEKIFAVFQRLHERSAYEGTGIGLAICKKIVENHHGKIHASGRPGDGSTFTIILPMP